MKERLKNFHHSAVFVCLVLAIVLDIILETLGRHSLIQAVTYIWNQPLIFLYNCSIIFFTLTLSLLIRKRVFGYCIISFAWLILGITNCIVLGFRITPFSAIDMLMARNTITIIDKYFSVWQVVLIGILLFASLAGLIVLFIKSPTVTGNIYRTRTTVFIVATFCCVMLFTKIALNAQTISDNFANLATAYKSYGFVYCFSNSVIDVGISQPSGYSQNGMLEIKDELDEVEASGRDLGKDKPNIIVVQLESFMDPSYVKGLSFSENPIVNFTRLKEECTSGFLTMPAIGAGTANSEFEVLTGFNVDYFGAGEYPYKTILGKQDMETMATQLKLDGYSTHAMHNHDGTFYDRYKVYKNMGFDSFTPMEFMYNIETTQKNWEKDKVLTGEIMKTLGSTPGRDFVFTVSVQGHGRYPSVLDEVNYSYPVRVAGTGDEELDTQWTYYCNQLREMDEFIGELISELEKSREPVVLLMYGDHLPGFDFTDDDVENGNLYQTEYFIWSNIKNFPVEDEDLEAYQISTKLFDMLGYEKSYIQKYHTLYKPGEEGFDEGLEKIEYDMLYGQRYMYPDGWPYAPTNMRYGISDIRITKIEKGIYTPPVEAAEDKQMAEDTANASSEDEPANGSEDEIPVGSSDLNETEGLAEDDTEDEEEAPEPVVGYYIHGYNFNECTFVWMDDSFESDTIYIDRGLLFYPCEELPDGSEVSIAQVGDDSIDFGISDTFIYHEK
ncbi:MAG: LTA synthase family protein [Coprococcus sp.]|nr:LTA synthase family protein [Coprococcus sp.]